MSIGLNIVAAEHQRLDAILDCLASIVSNDAKPLTASDLETVDTLIRYIEDFVYAFHHPKEDGYLFPAIKKRCPECAEAITKLESQHLEGAKTLVSLRELIDRARADPNKPETLQALSIALQLYVRFEQDHMKFENNHVYALARERLTAEDWAPIDEAFTNHNDPVFGDKPSEELRRRFSSLVAHVPEPYGLGHAEQTQIPPANTAASSVWSKLKAMLSRKMG